ncbi:MAG: HEAT repeat domain-containing protein [Chthonomonas sp.]|nr:HEAT repeat domain-containing protein [Chthonomonas sp.]
MDLKSAMYPGEHPVLLWLKEQGPKVLAAAALIGMGWMISSIAHPSDAKNPGFSKQQALDVESAKSVMRDQDSPPESRLQAAKNLLPYADKIEGAVVFEILLAEPEEEVAMAIAELTRKFPEHPDLVKAYIRRTKPRGQVRRRFCQLFMGTNRPEFLDMLRKFTYDPNSDTRIAAYSALGSSPSPRAGRILMLRMPYEEQKGTRQALLNALAKHKTKQDANKVIWGS